MIAKKNPKADLEKKRFAFFQIGLVVAGSLCLAAFEYSSAEDLTSKVYEFEPPSTTFMGEDPVYEPLEPPKEEKKSVSVIRLDQEVKTTKEPIPDPNAIIPDPSLEKISFDPDPGVGTEPGFTFEKPTGTIVEVPDVEPEFPGGLSEMANYINKNIELPDYIAEYDQGTVYVQFVVNQDGSIEQVGIRQGLSPELNKAAKEVVKKMPKWIPGEQAGKPVRVRFTLPIQITLN